MPRTRRPVIDPLAEPEKPPVAAERLTFRLEVDAFNVLNRSYYGTPGADLGDANFGSLNNFLNTPAQGSAVAGFGTGVRNMIFSGKILF